MYNFVIYIYLFAVKLVSLFNPKVKLMVKGHSEVFDILKSKIEKDKKYIWFHAASLGEFEQGRPLMERIRRQYPEYKILLTFFSTTSSVSFTVLYTVAKHILTSLLILQVKVPNSDTDFPYQNSL